MAPKTLIDLLEQAASRHPEKGLIIYPPGRLEDSPIHIPYPTLFVESLSKSTLIQSVLPDNEKPIVLLHFTNHQDSLTWFWATVNAHAIPCISTPFANDLDQRKKHILHLQDLLQKPTIITTRNLVEEFCGIEGLNIHAVEDLVESPNAKRLSNRPTADDIAVLMLTSGSTGNSKAVALRHHRVLAAVAGKSTYHGMTLSHTFLNWIGLDHVANLTEIHLQAMGLGTDQVHVQGSDVVPSPLKFLELIHKHRVAYTFAPNFFLASLRKILNGRKDINENWDLSCLKALISGGEANVVETCAALTSQLKRFGTPNTFIRPGFGMTETCAGSIYSKDQLLSDITQNLEFASLGSCIPGMQMRISHADGNPAQVDEEGNLEVTGTMVFSEYYNNPAATSDAFTSDGWFKTGDLATLSATGNLRLTGRAKDTIIINGVKHSPSEIETCLEESHIPGLTPSYTVVFAHRPSGSETEVICVVYLPSYPSTDGAARLATATSISRAVFALISVRPFKILPLNTTLLAKSSLGKLSRAKIRTAFEEGKYDAHIRLDMQHIALHRTASYHAPETDMQQAILSVFEDVFSLSAVEIGGIDGDLFALGMSSIDVLKLKHQLQSHLALKSDISITLFFGCQTIRALATAIEDAQTKAYDPVVVLQPEGTKAPLWLVHPGMGEILIFMDLARYVTDRPVYALRARGFEAADTCFASISEAVETYVAGMKRMQPHGPYAIAGYSFGGILAFEVAKVLEAQGDEVKFLASIDQPPHFKERARGYDWYEVCLSVAIFAQLVSEKRAYEILPVMRSLSYEEVVDHIFEIAPKERIEELAMTKERLTRWADLAHRLKIIAWDYEPQGSVPNLDVFYVEPLPQVASTMEEWFDGHLSKWDEFVRGETKYHRMQGLHATLISQPNVVGFQKLLKGLLTERGL